MACEPATVRLRRVHAHQQKPVAHGGDDGMRGVPRGGDRADDGERPSVPVSRPPSVPTFRSHLPSWISRSAASTRPRMSRSIDMIDVTSLMTRTPRSPILRNSPPVASLRRSRWCRGQQRAVGGDRAGDVAPMPLSACTVSVLALPGPEISSSQTRSEPSRTSPPPRWRASRRVRRCRSHAEPLPEYLARGVERDWLNRFGLRLRWLSVLAGTSTGFAGGGMTGLTSRHSSSTVCSAR